MTNPKAVALTAVSDRDLAADVDRVTAAVGVRPVRVDLPGRRDWLAAAAVVLDGPSAARCAEAGLPRRDSVFLVGPGVGPELWSAAVAVGARTVCALPGQESDLMHHLAEAADTGRSPAATAPMVAVVSGRGGAGASVFSAAVALSAGEALLVDLDPCGGGIDLLLGCEADPGLRWPDVHVQGGRLGWAAVRAALPRRDGLSILSGTRSFHEVDPGALAAVVDAARRGGVNVVCDVPRQFGPAALSALQSADLVVVVTSCDVRSVAATAATVTLLRTMNSAVGVVVRGPSPGGLSGRDAAAAAAAPLLGAMRPEPRLDQQLEQGGLRLRPRSPLARAAQMVLGVAHRGGQGRAA